MNLLAALIASGEEVVTLGPLSYRIVRLTSLEMMQAGAGVLLAARPTVEPDGKPEKAPDAKAVEGVVRFTEGMVIAGLKAISADGGETWQDVRIVPEVRQQSVKDSRLYIGNLLPGHASQLYAQILKLSTDGGAAGDQLASFLGGATSDASPGRQ